MRVIVLGNASGTTSAPRPDQTEKQRGSEAHYFAPPDVEGCRWPLQCLVRVHIRVVRGLEFDPLVSCNLLLESLKGEEAN